MIVVTSLSSSSPNFLNFWNFVRFACTTTLFKHFLLTPFTPIEPRKNKIVIGLWINYYAAGPSGSLNLGRTGRLRYVSYNLQDHDYPIHGPPASPIPLGPPEEREYVSSVRSPFGSWRQLPTTQGRISTMNPPPSIYDRTTMHSGRIHVHPFKGFLDDGGHVLRNQNGAFLNWD